MTNHTAPQSPENDRVIHGVALGFVLHLLQIPMLIVSMIGFGIAYHDNMAGLLGFLLPVFFGTSQVLYLGPAIAIHARTGEMNTARGLCLAGILTCVIHLICWIAISTPAPTR